MPTPKPITEHKASCKPKCKHYQKCGGCTLQHIEYEVQLQNKKKALADALKIESDKVETFFDKPYNYRNRMDFIFMPNGLGFRQKGKWDKLVAIEHCDISNEKINVLLKEIEEFFFHNPNVADVDCFDVKKKRGTFRYAVIRTPQDDSSISFVLNEDSVKLAYTIEQIKEFAKNTTAKNVIITRTPAPSDVSVSSDFFGVKGTDMLEETYLNKKFFYSVQGFFQNNHEMAEKMIDYTRNLLKQYSHTTQAHLLDLYGGVGAFGLSCADMFKSVSVVECVKECIDAAKKNIEENTTENAEGIVLDAKNLRKLKLPSPLFVITDPPRSGMHPKTITRLNELKPDVIIYVSCNIKQLGKDIPKFHDYELKSAALFDLFPQTQHCEGVVELVRKSK